MINRSYLQRKLKNNPMAQFVFVTYLYIVAQVLESNRNRWKNIQNKFLVKMLRYAQRHSLYYKKNLIDKDITNENVLDILKSLPLLEKSIIKELDKNIYSDEVTSNWSLWLNTGGSTGSPLKFPALYHGMPLEAICQMMLYRRMGYKWGDTIVSIGGNRVSEEDRKNNIFWEERGNFPYGKLNMSTLYMDSSTIKYYWNELNKVKPKFIRGYPSGIIDLCKLAKEQNILIKVQLKGIYLSSENFTQTEKNFISNFFKCPVYGQYGHTESSVFAVQNFDEDFYLCNPLYGYTEILNDKGEHVQVGEIGEITVTGFVEYGLPFIRYKTGDLAVYGGETRYNETIISKLLGRDVDYIINRKNRKIYLVGFIFGGHLNAFNYIDSWQIRQIQIGIIELYIVKGSGYSDDVEKELINLFIDNDFVVHIEYVTSIEKTIRGKQKFLIQEIKI